MSKLISLLLLTVFVIQVFNNHLLVISYQINKEYISKNLCENVDKPKMQCNGKCHLKKELKKQEKREQMPTSPTKTKSEVIFYSQQNKINIQLLSTETLPSVAYYLLKPYSGILSEIFHPPQV